MLIYLKESATVIGIDPVVVGIGGGLATGFVDGIRPPTGWNMDGDIFGDISRRGL
jgi:hypothetical protein